jgi:uncharacterized repeat protein (TIGR03803 family)
VKAESTMSINKLMFTAIAIAMFVTPRSQGQTFSVAHSFAGSDGSGPLAGLVIDAQGRLYGTASGGGKYGAGVVFEALRANERVLYNFGNGTSDGANPQGRLVMDKTGNLYGTTFAGGISNAGTVFKLVKGVETVLYTFGGGTDGANPEAGLAIDSKGNLYGTTTVGGASGEGAVFEIGKTGQHTILYSFGGANDGTVPVAGVTLDTKGNLYGATSTGGLYGFGTVFKLTRSQSGWTETILHNFQMLTDGGTPYGGLIFDSKGNLYGTVTDGGVLGSDGGGTIFELTPSGSSWNFSVIYGLAGWNISGPFRDLLFDTASGVIYGTTHCDGAYNAGTVWMLSPSAGTWTYTELYTFTGGTDGLYSFSNLVMDKSGNLYGTTNLGGANGEGVIFKVTP